MIKVSAKAEVASESQLGKVSIPTWRAVDSIQYLRTKAFMAYCSFKARKERENKVVVVVGL